MTDWIKPLPSPYTRPGEVISNALEKVESHFRTWQGEEAPHLDEEGVLSIVPSFPYNFGTAFSTEFRTRHPGSSKRGLPTAETVELATVNALQAVVRDANYHLAALPLL